MDIGSAKATLQEMQGIKHYMIDEVYPDQEFSVASFQQSAFNYIEEIIAKGKFPIIAGGTGLYINSITTPMDFTETISDWELREKLQQEAEQKGNAYVHGLLRQIDPVMAEKLHENDLRRVIRALEVYHHSGIPMSVYQQQSKVIPLKYEPIMVGLTTDRAVLYERINNRVDKMIKMGLIQEVEQLLSKGYDASLVSMQGLGYKEIVGYIQGECSLDYAIEILKRNTRRFAKRQLTWFRRDERIKWYDIANYKDPNKLAENIISDLEGELFFREN